MALTSPVGQKTCAVCTRANLLPQSRHIHSLYFWTGNIPASIFFLEFYLWIAVKFELSFLLVSLISFTGSSTGQREGKLWHCLGSIFWCETKKKPHHYFWGNSTMLNVKTWALRLSAWLPTIENSNIPVCLLVCSGCGEANYSRCFQRSEHQFIPAHGIWFLPPVYLSPDRVMILISIYMQSSEWTFARLMSVFSCQYLPTAVMITFCRRL